MRRDEIAVGDQHIRPRVVLSRCLELEPVRYDGQVIPYKLVRELEPFVSFVPVCPEVEIGLGVPRDPVRIVSTDGVARLLQPDTGRDVTAEMREFSRDFLSDLGPVDGFVLKSRSPSCGISDVKIYQGSDPSAAPTRGPGLFAERVLELHEGLAIEDEGRLRDYRIREHFLTKLFSLARLRAVENSGQMKQLVRFHSINKLLLMAYSQKEMRALGHIVANPDRASFDDVAPDYRQHFQAALARPPRYTSVINVFEHASEYFSNQLERREKGQFRSMLDKYRNKQVPMAAVTAVLRAWIVRFEEDYLMAQTFFEPYPAELRNI